MGTPRKITKLMDTTNLHGFNTEWFISEEMIAEEEKLEEEAQSLTMEKKETYDPVVNQERFDRFKKLLTHSEAYTDYLREKMDTQVHMRVFERSRKYSLMRLHRAFYEEKDIPCEKFMNDDKDLKNDEEARKDPTTVLMGEMLNVVGETVSLQQPFLLEKAVLRPYQLEGLHWLKVHYENGINGILADEMGLGKTLQCISLLCHMIEMGTRGPFLIVAPLSTLNIWLKEFRQFAPKVPIFLYHGNIHQRANLREKIKPSLIFGNMISPVVLTSYEIIIKDRRYLEKYVWSYLAIDEGHRIKNFSCRLVKELKRLKSNNRLLLSGTPLQNNLSELWSLMNFLLPEVFADLATFEMWFDDDDISGAESCNKIIQKELELQVLSTMHRILRPFILRRVKSEVEIDLPPKKEIIVHAPLTKLQEDYYKATLDKTIQKVIGCTEEEDELPPRKRSKSEKGPYFLRNSIESSPRKMSVNCPVGDTNIKMGNVTMQLRRIVNHPYLVHYPFDPATGEYQIDENLVNSSGKLLVMDAMLSRLKKMGHKVLVFSQMTKVIDILEDYLNLRGYAFVRLDGKMGMDGRQEAIDNFSKKETFIFLLSTRAGGLGLNLTSADTVIMFDSDWNPHADSQAMDRCHRIGQTSPVMVYRLVTAGTIDEQMVKKATGKKKLEIMIIQKGKFKWSKQDRELRNTTSLEELKELLRSNDHQARIQPNGFVFSDEELDSLLDRSDLLCQAEASTSQIAYKSSTKDEIKEMKLDNTVGKENKNSGDIHKLFSVVEQQKAIF